MTKFFYCRCPVTSSKISFGARSLTGGCDSLCLLLEPPLATGIYFILSAQDSLEIIVFFVLIFNKYFD